MLDVRLFEIQNFLTAPDEAELESRLEEAQEKLQK